MEVDKPSKKLKTEAVNVELTPSVSGGQASKYPKMELAQEIHCLMMTCGNDPKLDPDSAAKAGIPVDLKSIVKKQVIDELENPSLYRFLKSHVTGFEDDDDDSQSLTKDELTKMDDRNKEKYSELEKAIEEARENAGDMEVLEARFAVARFAAKSLSSKEALEAYSLVVALPKLSSGKKIDAFMEAARVASFYGNLDKNSELIQDAMRLEGDWDRRNRLKVYFALEKFLLRDIKEAASLLIDCIATFSCTELCSYSDFIVYTIISNMLHLPRTELKEKIIDGPEILTVIKELPVISKLVNCLYECDYKGYLHAMVEVQPILIADRFFQPHAGFILRELHVLGYKQFLDSYKSVTLDSMANSFGVSTSFLDFQLSRFIAAGRLTAKIDKFGGVVETNRPDLKNAQYRDMIQKGDLLLNRIQKLGRVVDV